MLRKKGFTLVEILFVLIIAAVIVYFAVPAYKRTKEHASYEAAVGMLLNVGNAIQNVKHDFAMKGINLQLPRTNDSFVLVTDPGARYRMGATQTPAQYFGDCSSDKINSCVLGIMFQRGYLKEVPAPSTGYNFYAIRGTPIATIPGNCNCSNSVACMCWKPTTSAPSCYQGAKMYADGTVERIKTSSCGG